MREYLTEMLCSFDRTNTGLLYWKQAGGFRKRKFSDVDVDDTIALCHVVEPAFKPRFYKRMADIAFFLMGCTHSSHSAARHGSHDQERLRTSDDRIGQLGIRRFEGQIFFAGEESDEWPPPQSVVIANRPAQHWIVYFECIENRAHRGRTFHLKLHLAIHVRQVSQVIWKHDADHGKV